MSAAAKKCNTDRTIEDMRLELVPVERSRVSVTQRVTQRMKELQEVCAIAPRRSLDSLTEEAIKADVKRALGKVG